MSRYDAYRSYAQLFLGGGMAKEARLFESLADLCYEKEKAQLLGRIDQMLEAWVDESLPKKGPRKKMTALTMGSRILGQIYGNRGGGEERVSGNEGRTDVRDRATP